MNEPFDGKEPTSAKDVFEEINSRQVKALMFHSEAADLFGFMGLEGFKHMHEYQYLAESAEHREIKSYFLKAHDKILPDDSGIKPVEVVPDDWLQYTRMDVTPSIRKQHTERVMNLYRNWEEETLKVYSMCAHYLMNWGEVTDFCRVKDLIKDVQWELFCLKDICLRLRSVEYDPGFIVSLQEELTEKYKEKPIRMES